MSVGVLLAAGILTFLIVAVIFAVDERHKRKLVEEERDWARMRADVLEGQIPFPYSEDFRTNHGRVLETRTPND